MATILVAWELGGGWGHLLPLRPIIEGLVQRGHAVVAVMRNLARAGYVLADCPARLVQAPMRIGPVRDPIRNPNTFAQILHDTGFADELELRALARAWRTLFQFVKPELLLCDHSPTALLASRGLPMRRAVLGFGFICPPDQHPLPNLRFWTKPDPHQMAADDAAVLGRMNRVLEYLREPPLDRVTQIYGDADATYLTTFKELDQFPWRQGAQYRGPWTVAAGKPPQWPQGAGPRVYVYLKDCPALPDVIHRLAASGHPTLAYVETANPKVLQTDSPTLRIERDRLDMNRVAKECDLAVCHAPHGTTAAMLLAGKPLLFLPIFLEQGLTAHAVSQMGAALQAPAADPHAALTQLDKLLASPDTYAPAAARFAEKYAGYDPHQSNDRLLDDIESLLTPSESRQLVVAQT